MRTILRVALACLVGAAFAACGGGGGGEGSGATAFASTAPSLIANGGISAETQLVGSPVQPQPVQNLGADAGDALVTPAADIDAEDDCT